MRAENFYFAIKGLGLTIKEFAEILEVSYPTARKYAHDPESISGKHLLKFLKSDVCKRNNFTFNDFIKAI